MMAGTPCPYNGAIGDSAKTAWVANVSDRPDAKEHKKRLRREAKKDKADKKKKDKAAKAVTQSAYNDFLAVCTLEPNPTRERIKRDVVGAIDSIVTPKTKTPKQCAKEYESVSS